MSAAELVATSVRVQRGDRIVLDEVSLTVRAGTVVALVGPNGAGKSTLLRQLALDETPDGGTVTLAGRTAGQWRARDLARVRAVLPQQVQIAFPFLVEDVVAMGRAPWRGADVDDAALTAAAIRDAEVADLLGRQVTGLSGGEAARVSFARFLAQDASVLLLDEPTAAMDPHHQEHCFEVLRQRADVGAAVAVVLHDLNLAAAWADEVVVLAGGRAVAAGAPADVLTDDVLTRAYGHPMEVCPHPRTGAAVVLPRR